MPKKKQQITNITVVQKIAYGYGVGFVLIIFLFFIPGTVDVDGKLFGLFRNVAMNHVLHALSAIWAVYAASKSEKATLFFLRVFGTLYFLDGLSGLVFGYNFLNLHFASGEAPTSVAKRLPANMPHIVIGGIAMILGFMLYKHFHSHDSKKRSV